VSACKNKPKKLIFNKTFNIFTPQNEMFDLVK
jgi:hypothetical protein